eukprot:2385172-Rhodomonas_salina.1
MTPPHPTQITINMTPSHPTSHHHTSATTQELQSVRLSASITGEGFREEERSVFQWSFPSRDPTCPPTLRPQPTSTLFCGASARQSARE